jgi:hypothetical protein
MTHGISGCLRKAWSADSVFTLTEVQITNGELGSLNVHWEVHLTPARQILDIAVSSMFGATRHGTRSLLPNLLFDVCRSATSMYVLRLRRERDVAVEVLVRRDELCLARIPRLEDFGRGRTAEDTGMDQAGEADAGNVAGGAEDTFEVPDGFCAVFSLYQPMVLGEIVVGLTASGTIRRGSLLHSL